MKDFSKECVEAQYKWSGLNKKFMMILTSDSTCPKHILCTWNEIWCRWVLSSINLNVDVISTKLIYVSYM